MNEKKIYTRIRLVCGILGMLLPILAAVGAGLYRLHYSVPEGFWSHLSISATYYMTPVLAAILTAASIVLMTYDGYGKVDNLVTTASGVLGMLIVLFPCKCSLAGDYTGFFMLPANVSAVIHNISACLFFVLLAFNSAFLFTQNNGKMTKQKKMRNKIYVACAIAMVIPMLWIVLPVWSPSKTFVAELIMLEAFGISWLVKSDTIRWLKDK